MKKPETKIENKYCIWLRDIFPKKAIALKLILFAGNGFPDRTILCEGKVFFIEFKIPDDPGLDPNQVVWYERLTKLGFKVYVCTSFTQAEEITKKHLETA